MKALIVEDDSLMASFLEIALQSRGHQVVSRQDSASALEAYQAEDYPLVLVDWLMIGTDRLELCRQMRALKGDTSVILVLTGGGTLEGLVAVLEAGGDDYLIKPLSLELLDLRLTIAEMLARQRQARASIERKLSAVATELESSHGNLVTLLNHLQVGAAMTDGNGRITFLNRRAASIFGGGYEQGASLSWRDFFSLEESSRQELETMSQKPPPERSKVSVHVKGLHNTHFWMEIAVEDDPRDHRCKIFYMYDVSEIQNLRKLLDGRAHFHDLVGKSPSIQQVIQQIKDVAPIDFTVLIEGETGTGKELVARALHSTSHRSERPFIAINCAGLTDSLLTSQLFGHRRGAFTGATQDHVGLFEAADGGTLFLDEIGDIPLNVQTVLLRVLQEREVTRLGESTPRKIDVRVLAATHRDLSEEVRKGSFRSDLLYRIRGARISVPPLRQRREDIPLLVAAFLPAIQAATGREAIQVGTDAMRPLLAYGWPGNVRELRGTLEYAVMRSHGPVIQVGDLPDEILQEPPVPSAPSPFYAPPATSQPSKQGEAIRDNEHYREEMLSALRHARGNRAEAARLLGISRSTFYRYLARYDIDTSEQSASRH